MKKMIPAILLAILCIVLSLTLYSTQQENSRLKQQLSDLSTISDHPKSTPIKALKTEDQTTSVLAAQSAIEETTPMAETPDAEKEAGQRMMSNIAKMMENPTMNKMMVASQRGAIGSLYADMVEYLDLNSEEADYFLDLLMIRQMKQVDLGMKMMAGNMSEEEKKALTDELTEAEETVKSEMEKFLNNPEDYAEFKFYEKTMGERMMLSSLDQKLGSSDAALSSEAYRDLLSIMHEEKKSYDFSTNLNDEKNMDLSSERFSKDNLQNYSTDMDNLNRIIIQKAQAILTPEQLRIFEAEIKSSAEMQKSQLEMAAKMFGGGK